MVLVLPAMHTGGNLMAEHGDETVRFASQHLRADALRGFAFFADCKHEVQAVEEGWRVVLTFQVSVALEAEEPLALPDPALVTASRHRFDKCHAQSQSPWVLLLDHGYSERGLQWSLLKGEDRPRVAALRAAAQALDLSVHLALAQLHKSYNVAGMSRHPKRGGSGKPPDDELIEDGTELDFWGDAQGRVLRREGLLIKSSQVHSFAETDESFLVKEE